MKDGVVNMKNSLFRVIPKVDEVLSEDRIQEILNKTPRTLVLDVIRNEIENTRNEIKSLTEEEASTYKFNYDKFIANVLKGIKGESDYNLKRVVNGTGVVIHTNLGRSSIGKYFADHLVDIATNYSTLEFDITNGKRGSRYSHVEELICKLTGSEAAMVVNNNAAAVLLVLDTMGKGKEVIVSRGQLVEIGGSFRVPDVMKASGADLIEVGTTNKTHLRDYENVINENTGAILKVHTSNYRILGFTQEVPAEDMVVLGHKYDLPVIEDIGSGSIIDFSKYGLTKEPTVKESLDAGVDVVTFSGDKMLGGPQAGIIAGKKEYIDRMKKNQLTRALRVDKMTLGVLEAILKSYLDETIAIKEIPTLRMLTMPLEVIEQKAERLAAEIEASAAGYVTEIVDDYSEVGGGSLPLEKMDTKLVSINHGRLTTNQISTGLRSADVPVICRSKDDRVLLDPRTIDEDEFDLIIEGLKHVCVTMGGINE